jgi:tetratricopeptide (TPR) repeat protein
VFKPAEDVDATPNSSPPPSEPSPAIASGSNADKTPKPSKRTLLQWLNPLNLFTADTKPSSPTPLPGSTADQIASVEAGSSPAEPVARYQYESPQRPAAGKRREAERVFAEAVHAQQIQQLPEAIKDYQRAADLDPSFYDAHYNLGLAATQAGELPLALRAYETALAIRPDSLDARYNFALVLKQSNYAVDSAHELQKIIADSPDESRAHLALGNLYAQQFHDLAKARPHYLKVLESDPHNPQADAIRVWLAGHPR